MPHNRFTGPSNSSRTVAARDRRDRFSAAPLPPPPKPSAVNAHKAALEALFTPKPQEAPEVLILQSRRESAKMVTSRQALEGPEAKERAKLLEKLLAAEGRPAISKAAETFLARGFTFPEEQEIQLQLLEHTNEERVKGALVVLAKLLESEPAKRKTVLDARLRRLEEGAEDAEVRELTSALRRKLAGR